MSRWKQGWTWSSTAALNIAAVVGGADGAGCRGGPGRGSHDPSGPGALGTKDPSTAGS